MLFALPAAQIADGVTLAYCCPHFPIFAVATHAQVISRRDTFAGHITLLFGHYNGVGIYPIDAPHLDHRPGSRITIPMIRLDPQRIAFCAAGWVGAEMASGLDPFWRPTWCTGTTGMQALRLRIGGARASGEVGVDRAQPAHQGRFMHII
ncbi:hypothetical protein ACNKHT_22415 [Shigella flexneri]